MGFWWWPCRGHVLRRVSVQLASATDLAHVPDSTPLSTACHAAQRGPRQARTAWTMLRSLVTVPWSRWVQVMMETPGNLPPRHSPDAETEVTDSAHARKIHGRLRNQRTPFTAQPVSGGHCHTDLRTLAADRGGHNPAALSRAAETPPPSCGAELRVSA